MFDYGTGVSSYVKKGLVYLSETIRWMRVEVRIRKKSELSFKKRADVLIIISSLKVQEKLSYLRTGVDEL